MKFLRKLKESRIEFAKKRKKRMRRSWDMVGKTSTKDRLLANQGELIQNADTLGGVVTDGLNRFV